MNERDRQKLDKWYTRALLFHKHACTILGGVDLYDETKLRAFAEWFWQRCIELEPYSPRPSFAQVWDEWLHLELA